MKKEVFVVIGGSRGIGEATVRRIAREDRIVVFTYNHSEDRAAAISRELNEKNNENNFFKLDVLDHEAVTAFFEGVWSRFRDISGLVNNAGITRDNLLYMIDDKDWFDVINTNLSGVFFSCRAASKYMIMQRRGKIVNMSSVVVRKGATGQANYCASKGGIEALTRSLAVELAKRNITVNCVSPGVIETDMTASLIEKYGNIINSSILLNRPGKPEEVANVVNFLLSGEASYINGQIINVDGGML